MRNTRIILVEGMPGTGKSTVSQFIHQQLQANGRPSFWCHEESAAHPVCLFYDRQRHRLWSDYCDQAESLWRHFAGELQSRNQIAVLDAAVLQNHVRSMLLFECDRNSILRLIRTIENVLSSLDPIWIYLRPTDVERNFRDVIEVRGERMLELWLKAQQRFPYAQKTPVGGFPGFMAFWEEFGQIADRAFDELTMSKLKLSVSNEDWTARFRDLLAFLRLPSASDFATSQSLERYTGKYVSLQDNPAVDRDGSVARPALGEFMLTIRDGCLIATVDQPTIDIQQGPIGCFREVRLISNAKNRFSIAAWPHAIEFTEGEQGEIVSLRLSVSEYGWKDSQVVYLRQ
jgi:hypothetical protein